MFCQTCGKEVKDTSRFCKFCGAQFAVRNKAWDDRGEARPIQKKNYAPSRVEPSKPKKEAVTYQPKTLSNGIPERRTPMIPIIIGVLVGALMVTGGYFGYKQFLSKDKKDAGIHTDETLVADEGSESMAEGVLKEAVQPDNRDIPEKVMATSEIDTEESAEIQDEDTPELESAEENVKDLSEEEKNDDNASQMKLMEEYGISSDATELFSEHLDPRLYRYRYTEIPEFYFAYPPGLFNNVTEDDSPFETSYGTNIKTVTFYGTNGSELIYRVVRRNDGKSLTEMTKFVHSEETNGLINPSDILNKTTDTYGKVIVTGYSKAKNSFPAYDMVKVGEEYVYQMYKVFPNYENEEDRQMKAYITECLYRMCGFSDSSKGYRTWDAYLENRE